MMLCWHTSATRSAYALAVSLDSPPSDRALAAEVDQALVALR